MNNSELNRYFKAIRNGDVQSFEVVYDDMKVPIYTIAYRITYSKEESEDIMQDVFVKLFRSPPESNIANLRAWIFKMTHNLAIDRKRQFSKLRRIPEIDFGDILFEQSLDIQLSVEKAMFQLKDDEREIVTLHLNAAMKFREISTILKTPIGTVLWKYRKSIEKLRRLISVETTVS
jgi:RNA polymerase sigma-70 factor (ECF subfamily)